MFHSNTFGQYVFNRQHQQPNDSSSHHSNTSHQEHQLNDPNAAFDNLEYHGNANSMQHSHHSFSGYNKIGSNQQYYPLQGIANDATQMPNQQTLYQQQDEIKLAQQQFAFSQFMMQKGNDEARRGSAPTVASFQAQRNNSTSSGSFHSYQFPHAQQDPQLHQNNQIPISQNTIWGKSTHIPPHQLSKFANPNHSQFRPTLQPDQAYHQQFQFSAKEQVPYIQNGFFGGNDNQLSSQRSFSVAYPPQSNHTFHYTGGANGPIANFSELQQPPSHFLRENLSAGFPPQLRAYSVGNIQTDLFQDNPYGRPCGICDLPINRMDDYSFTYHPMLKYFCPSHKECQKSLKRDSLLVAVPKFEIKAISESDWEAQEGKTRDIEVEKQPKHVVVNFEILQVDSNQSVYQKNDIEITSSVLVDEKETVEQVRHLYYFKFDDNITVTGSGKVMFQIVWKRVNQSVVLAGSESLQGSTRQIQSSTFSIAKVAKGIMDLEQVVSKKVSKEITSTETTQGLDLKDIQFMLDQQDDVNVEIEMNVKNQSSLHQGIQLHEPAITYQIESLSFILEVKEISDNSTTSSTFARKDSRHYSIDALGQLSGIPQIPRQYSIGGCVQGEQDYHKQGIPPKYGKLQNNVFEEMTLAQQKKKANSIFVNLGGQHFPQSFSPIQMIGQYPSTNVAFGGQNQLQIGVSQMAVNQPPPTSISYIRPQVPQIMGQDRRTSVPQTAQAPQPFKQGEIIQMILTKQGSKDLQKAIERAHPAVIEQIVCEIQDKLAEVLIDQYGNYFCQKLFVKLSNDQQQVIINTLGETHITEEQKREKTSKKRLKSKLLFVSSDSRGTHAIQSLIESIAGKSGLLMSIAELFAKDCIKFAYNKHATHVLIKFVKTAEPMPHLEKIYEAIVSNFEALCQDPNGLPLIKTTIQRFNIPEMKKGMIDEMGKHVVALSQNAYGNYALQVALEHWSNEDCQEIYKGLIPQLQQLSVQKFASNVIEKVLDKADQKIVCMYSDELSVADRIRILVRVNYGYYVVERVLLRCSNEAVKAKLRDEVFKNLSFIGANNLKGKWVDLLEKSRLGLLNTASPQEHTQEPHYGGVPQHHQQMMGGGAGYSQSQGVMASTRQFQPQNQQSQTFSNHQQHQQQNFYQHR